MQLAYHLILISNIGGEAKPGRIHKRLVHSDCGRMDVILLAVPCNPSECLLVLRVPGDSYVTIYVPTGFPSCQDVHKSCLSRTTHSNKGCENARPK